MKLQFPFNLYGSSVDKLWRDITPNKWNDSLSEHWTDRGFHFFSQVRERGPKNGINTPSDLESEILKGIVKAFPEIQDRFQIVLPIINSTVANLCVFYDYDKQKKLCQLVTISFRD